MRVVMLLALFLMLSIVCSAQGPDPSGTPNLKLKIGTSISGDVNYTSDVYYINRPAIISLSHKLERVPDAKNSVDLKGLSLNISGHLIPPGQVISNEIILKEKNIKFLNYTVEIPKNFTPGNYYFFNPYTYRNDIVFKHTLKIPKITGYLASIDVDYANKYFYNPISIDNPILNISNYKPKITKFDINPINPHEDCLYNGDKVRASYIILDHDSDIFNCYLKNTSNSKTILNFTTSNKSGYRDFNASPDLTDCIFFVEDEQKIKSDIRVKHFDICNSTKLEYMKIKYIEDAYKWTGLLLVIILLSMFVAWYLGLFNSSGDIIIIDKPIIKNIYYGDTLKNVFISNFIVTFASTFLLISFISIFIDNLHLRQILFFLFTLIISISIMSRLPINKAFYILFIIIGVGIFLEIFINLQDVLANKLGTSSIPAMAAVSPLVFIFGVVLNIKSQHDSDEANTISKSLFISLLALYLFIMITIFIQGLKFESAFILSVSEIVTILIWENAILLSFVYLIIELGCKAGCKK